MQPPRPVVILMDDHCSMNKEPHPDSRCLAMALERARSANQTQNALGTCVKRPSPSICRQRAQICRTTPTFPVAPFFAIDINSRHIIQTTQNLFINKPVFWVPARVNSHRGSRHRNPDLPTLEFEQML
jgi:hypothetical protein